MLKITHLEAFEFFVYYPLLERGGKKIRIDFKDNVIVTENGAEVFIPLIDMIQLVR